MQFFRPIGFCALALVVAAGCAKLTIHERQEYKGERSRVLPTSGSMTSPPRLPRCRPTLPLPVRI